MASLPQYPQSQQSQINRIKSRHLGMAPAVISDPRPAQVAPGPATILVHRCYATGESKPASCRCKERITFYDAALLVADKKAQWLGNNQRSIVIRQSKAAVAEHEPLRKEGLKFQNSFLPVEAQIFDDFKKWLDRMARGENLPPVVLTWSDSFLKTILRNPDIAAEECPAFMVRKPHEDPKKTPQLFNKLMGFSAKWWEDVLAFNGLSEDAGLFITDAEQGRGEIVYKPFTTNDIDAIRGHCFVNPAISQDPAQPNHGMSHDLEQKGQRKASAANHRANEVLDESGEGTNQWDFSTGNNPDLGDDENEEGYYDFLETRADENPEEELQ
jgi:hypothetical protein